MLGGGFFADEDELIEPPPPRAAPAVPLYPPVRRHVATVETNDFDEEGEAALDELEREEHGELVHCPLTNRHDGGQEEGEMAATLGTCVDCADAPGQPRFFEAFGLNACYDCQRAAKGPGGKYQLMTKSKAKDEYLLTDRQLSREYGGLGCLLQPNPYAQHGGRAHGGDMKLYLRSQVEQVSLEVWGSDEALFTERERRREERQDRAEVRKRKVASREAAARSGTVVVPPSKRPAAISKPTGLQSARPSHTHTFLPDETYDEASDMWTKRCACGFQVEYERL